TRLWAEVLASDPKLADDWQAGHRYNAARAALAAAGRSQGEAPLDEAAKAKLRQQALGWLKADLALWNRQGLTGQPTVGAGQRGLKQWQEDGDLRGIREAGELARLTAEERSACEKFWAEVVLAQTAEARGVAFACRGQWARAAKEALSEIAAKPGARFLWTKAAALLVLAGDSEGHRQLCARMVEQFQNTTHAEQAESVCKACLLLPGSIDGAKLPVDVLMTAANNDSTGDQFCRWFHASVALIALRDKQFEKAIA